MKRSLLALMFLFFSHTVFAAEKPNVVVFVIDDTRWDSLGCAGNSVIVTPNIDRLAQRGVRFSEARVTTSICMVSRASMLTGQHMARHGIDHFGVPLKPDAVAKTYPALLHDAGYWTGYVGKYGVGKLPEKIYDFSTVYEGRHWIEPKNGARIHVTEKNTRDSLAFLKQRPKDKPFCLCVGFYCPHAEDRAPEQYLPQNWSAKLYEGKTIPVPELASEADLQALPEFLKAEANEGRIRWKKRFDTPEKFQRYMTNYYRLITEVDAGIGRIMAELKKQNADENTLIVAVGDNGYYHAERGLADKWYPYEQALRVPLIVVDPRLPAAKRGLVRDDFALNIDLAPTILAATGITIPQVMQGKDLAPQYLSANPAPLRESFYYVHPIITNKERIPSSEGVITRDWKYIHWPDYEYEQLFHTKADPLERKNLIDDPASARQLKKMRQELKTLRDAVK